MDGERFDAVVLAGGSARRLDGAGKTQLRVGAATLLDRVLAAAAGAARLVVVGPAQPVAAPVHWACEEPAGSGPVAALAAALPLIDAPTVLVLAADLPFVAGAVPQLLAALAADPHADAAVLTDSGGRANHLAAAWRRAALAAAVAGLGPVNGAAMRALTAGARVAAVPDAGGWSDDCDTWDDLAAARARDGGIPHE